MHLSFSSNEYQYSLDAKKCKNVVAIHSQIAVEKSILYSKPSKRFVVVLPLPNVGNTERWTKERHGNASASTILDALTVFELFKGLL